MPHFRNVSVTNPIVLQAASNFTWLSELNVPLSGTYGHYAIRGDNARRGACHFQDNTLTSVLLRGPTITPSPSIIRSESFADFYENDFTIGPGTPFRDIFTLNFIGEYLWILGQNTSFQGKVLTIQAGLSLEGAPNFIDRSVDLPSGYEPSNMRQARDTTLLYYTARSGVGELRIMRGANASSVFSNICTTTVVLDSNPTAYGISDTGAVQMVFYLSGALVSLDGGVTWSPMTVPLAHPIKDVTYSKKFDRWAITNGVSSAIYSSTNNGTSWDNGQWVTLTSQTFGAWAPICHLERLDVEGRYILAVAGFSGIYANVYTYLSEDGGLSWIMSQVLRVPNYGAIPANSSPVLVNAGSRVFIYMGNLGDAWSINNSVFATPIISFATP